MRRVRRGTLRRLLRRPPRYGWYQLASIDTDARHADYAFRGVRSATQPDRPALRAGRRLA